MFLAKGGKVRPAGSRESFLQMGTLAVSCGDLRARLGITVSHGPKEIPLNAIVFLTLLAPDEQHTIRRGMSALEPLSLSDIESSWERVGGPGRRNEAMMGC